MKKIFALIISVELVLNVFTIMACSAEEKLTAHDFLQMVMEFSERNQPGAFGSGDITDYPLNRLLVKTLTNDPLEEDYGARDLVEGFDCMHILQYNTREETKKAYESFKKDSAVEYVEYDFWLSKANNPFGSEGVTGDITEKSFLSWNSEAVGVDKAFEYINSSGVKLDDVVVAVIDTGMFVDHEYFDENRIVVDSKYTYVEDYVSYPTNEDPQYHGTHVAGIIYDNSMDNVKISPYRVMGEEMENMTYSVMTTVLDAIIDSENKIDVINMSIYFRRYDDDLTNGIDDEKRMAELLQEAVDKNIVVVTIAGNKGGDCAEFWPAQFKNGITVASSTQNNKPHIGESKHGDSVDIAAPGVDINSTVPRTGPEADGTIGAPQSLYYVDSGTSMAAPLVSAAAALIKSIDPDITPAEVERIIKETAYVPDDWEESCGGKNYGTGIVNFYNIAKAMLGEGESQTPEIKITSDNKFEISVPGGSDARFYYTLDGSMPTLENHLTYSESLSLINTYSTEINVVCHENGKLISEPVTYDMITYKTKTIFYKSTGVLKSNAGCKNAYWSSYNSDIAQVDNQGNITANSVGNTKITCLLQTGERIIWKVNVIYNPIQAFFVLFFFGFLWI